MQPKTTLKKLEDKLSEIKTSMEHYSTYHPMEIEFVREVSDIYATTAIQVYDERMRLQYERQALRGYKRI